MSENQAYAIWEMAGSPMESSMMAASMHPRPTMRYSKISHRFSGEMAEVLANVAENEFGIRLI